MDKDALNWIIGCTLETLGTLTNKERLVMFESIKKTFCIKCGEPITDICPYCNCLMED